jgi:hypothetical protein
MGKGNTLPHTFQKLKILGKRIFFFVEELPLIVFVNRVK